MADLLKVISPVLGGCLDVLNSWAKEPLKKFEHNRQQEVLDNELNRKISEAQALADIEIKKDEETTNLQIRLQTEVNRINTEIEQWRLDKEFERQNEINEAIIRYQKEMSDIQVSIVRAIAEMDIELRRKAQDLIIEKTNEYQRMRIQAVSDSASMYKMIKEQCGDDPIMFEAMRSSIVSIQTGLINSTTQCLAQLSDDIVAMNKSIDRIVEKGNSVIDTVISNYGIIQNKLSGGNNTNIIQNG